MDVFYYWKDMADDRKHDRQGRLRSTKEKLSELKANYSEAQATASRRAAMDELKNSEADYKAKLEALGTATGDTWDAAKNNVVLAWDRMQASYHKARAN